MRVQVDDLPRIESISTSSTASSLALSGYFSFHRSRPASANFLSGESAIVMSGIERFQQRQRARAAEIERQGAMLRQFKDRAESDEKARSELAAAQERYDWDVRVFTERQQSLPLACEVPVLIEQRLFELGREIRSRMTD